MDPELILQQARAALARGADPAAVDQRVSELTGGLVRSVSQLEREIGRPAPLSTEAPRDVTAPRAAAPEGARLPYAVLRGLAEGMSFGFADELVGAGAALVPGGRSYREARDASRANFAQAREDHPVATLGAELVGAFVAPGAGLARGVPTLARAVQAGRQGRALGTAARVGGIGAIEGGLFGAGTAEELGDVPGDVLLGSLFGLGTGAAAGFVGAGAQKVRQAARPVPEVPEVRVLADKLAEVADVPEGRIGGMVRAARAHVREVADEVFGPLDAAFDQFRNPDIERVIWGNIRGAEEAQKVIRKAANEVFGAPRKAADGSVILPDLSFRKLQRLERKLRGMASKARRDGDPAQVELFSEASAMVRGVMEETLPGYAEAQAAYRQAQAEVRAFQEGQRAWGAGSKTNRPEQIAEALDRLSPQEAANFRAGAVSVFYDELSRRGGKVTQSMIDKLQSIGWQGRLRNLFPNEQAFQRFNQTLEETGEAVLSARQIERARKDLARFLRNMLFAAGGYGIARGLSGGPTTTDNTRSTSFEVD